MGIDGLSISLKSSDDFDTAIMKDGSGKEYHLKSAPAASGIFMKNSDGVSIHFKGDMAILKLENGQEFNIIPLNNH